MVMEELAEQPPTSVVNHMLSGPTVTRLCEGEHTTFVAMSDDERDGSFKFLNDLRSPFGESSGAHGGISAAAPQRVS